MSINHYKHTSVIFFISLAIAAYSKSASANHSWGNYHWPRTSQLFTLKLGDNLTSAWDPYLSSASYDWSLSSVLDTVITPGLTTAKRCKPTIGRVEVCNNKYGRNGWLGVAQIWASGDHIVQGAVKLNDTYFDTSSYNSTAWKNLVMCQEVGHTLGLDHQDEDFNNTPLGTCMDYSSNPYPNQHPNNHDYEQLEIIYSHLDNIAVDPSFFANQFPSIMMDNLETPAQWGKLIRRSNQGLTEIYELDLGRGHKMFTFVIWAKKRSKN